jgi:hypothetical protein
MLVVLLQNADEISQDISRMLKQNRLAMERRPESTPYQGALMMNTIDTIVQARIQASVIMPVITIANIATRSGSDPLTGSSDMLPLLT